MTENWYEQKQGHPLYYKTIIIVITCITLIYILLQKNHGDAKGGPYLSVHLRRKDYLYAHKEQVPSLKYAAKQIKELLKKNKLKKVFIASDCDENGKNIDKIFHLDWF